MIDLLDSIQAALQARLFARCRIFMDQSSGRCTVKTCLRRPDELGGIIGLRLRASRFERLFYDRADFTFFLTVYARLRSCHVDTFNRRFDIGHSHSSFGQIFVPMHHSTVQQHLQAAWCSGFTFVDCIFLHLYLFSGFMPLKDR
jgi:hypothetical protein